MQSAFRAIRAFVGVLLFLGFLVLIGFGALEEVATSDNLESIVMGVVSALLMLSVGIYFWVAQPQNR
ncbi:hypothetical protein DTL42_18275 [Bremerella cremea]|uniref:Uncharacterized protein n=1 Tax=Bremerella cremea TaxID=1031537 RepID=A0A368KQ98_9BACT|nr:hypothetical protein DTL42_18275 [Bremerella cremea]